MRGDRDHKVQGNTGQGIKEGDTIKKEALSKRKGQLDIPNQQQGSGDTEGVVGAGAL
jgi:hypothetical protein